VNITDGIDLGLELLPRRAKRAVGALLLIMCLFFTGTYVRIVEWYATQRSQEIVKQIERMMPTTTPTARP
jgi:hypothetical protein